MLWVHQTSLSYDRLQIAVPEWLPDVQVHAVQRPVGHFLVWGLRQSILSESLLPPSARDHVCLYLKVLLYIYCSNELCTDVWEAVEILGILRMVKYMKGSATGSSMMTQYRTHAVVMSVSMKTCRWPRWRMFRQWPERKSVFLQCALPCVLAARLHLINEREGSYLRNWASGDSFVYLCERCVINSNYYSKYPLILSCLDFGDFVHLRRNRS